MKPGEGFRLKFKPGELLCIVPLDLLEYVVEQAGAVLPGGQEGRELRIKVPGRKPWVIKTLFFRGPDEKADVRGKPRRHQARRSKK